MKRLFKSKQLVTIIAIIVCFVILFFAYRYRVDKAINAVSIPIAAKDLKARDLIDNESFKTVKVASSMLTKNVIMSPTELVCKSGDTTCSNKYVNYNTFIPEGSMFYRSAVTTWDYMPDSAWSNIQDGYTVISLRVNSNTTYGNSIFPGDIIDLYYKNREGDKFFIGPLYTKVKVLAVKDSIGNHIFKRSAQQTDAAALIFAVPQKSTDPKKCEDFLCLKAAMTINGGDIIPVPRNASYSEEKTDESGETTPLESKSSAWIVDFIKNRSKLHYGDN